MLVRRELSDLTLKPRLRRGGGDSGAWGAAIFIRGRSTVFISVRDQGRSETARIVWPLAGVVERDRDEGGTAKPIAALLYGRRELVRAR